MTTLSVIIPVLNDAELLRTALASLASQNRPVDEVIVVDNGCTDHSVAVALEAGARVIAEPRPGIPAAASAGLNAATSDLLARIDTDSVVPPDWSERLVKAFETMPEVGAVTGPGAFYDLPPGIGRLVGAMYMNTYFMSMELLAGQRPVFGSNYAIRADVWRDVVDDIHLDANVHDDMDLSFVLDGRHRIHYDHSLSVGISPRPVTSARSLARHMLWTGPTVAANWRDRGPVRRVLDRRAARAPSDAR